MPTLRPLAGLLLVLTCTGCTALATYGQDRLRDLSDVIDPRYGTGFGLGISVQFLDAYMSGVGCSMQWYQREWFGRKSVVVRDGLFAHALVYGVDGDYVRRLGPGEWEHDGSSTTGSMTIVIFNTNRSHGENWSGDEQWFTEPGGNYPNIEGARIGGAVYLPGVNAGLYLNLGELFDFLCGLTTYDPAHDDGYPKFFTPEDRTHHGPCGSAAPPDPPQPQPSAAQPSAS